MTIDPVAISKLEPAQLSAINRLRIRRGDVNVAQLVHLIVDGIFRGRNALVAENLVQAIELIGPLAIDEGKKVWHYSNGVWLPDGLDELSRRVQLCTGARYRKDHINQVASIITTRVPKIHGLGSKDFFNVKNGMLNWKTLELLPHDPEMYSTVQLRIKWDPNAKCPQIDDWMNETFDPAIHGILFEIIGVAWFPGMGFQKAIVLVGDGFNGKGTVLRLCASALPKSAMAAIDPKVLTTNRFMTAELFGKTLNVCGDIERFTINSTAEIKKITGEDPIQAERKMGHPFTFTNQSTMLFSGNRMPPSRDTSHGWFRRWLIVPMEKQIESMPDPDLEARLQTELEGLLVKSVHGLRAAMANGGFNEPEVCQLALAKYRYSCNTSALFIYSKLEFSEKSEKPISRNTLYASYESYCIERGLEIESREKFYEMLKQLGGSFLHDKWGVTSDGRKERGYVGVSFVSSYGVSV